MINLEYKKKMKEKKKNKKNKVNKLDIKNSFLILFSYSNDH